MRWLAPSIRIAEPVRFLLKHVAIIHASCYDMSTGFLQNDRGVVDSFRTFLLPAFNPPAIYYALSCPAASIL
jgi:hypothetical protein